MRFWVCAVAVFNFLLCAGIYASDSELKLETLFNGEITPGKTEKDAFLEKWGKSFSESDKPGVFLNSASDTFLGLKTNKCAVSFSNADKLDGISIIIYDNAGKLSSMEPETFDFVVKKIIALIDKWTENEGREYPPEKTKDGITACSKTWQKSPYTFELKWTYNKEGDDFYPGYIKFQTFKPVVKTVPAAAVTADKKKTTEPAEKLELNVQKESNGDVIIANIPRLNSSRNRLGKVFIDRVLKYYRIEIDPDFLNRVIETNPIKLLKKVSSKHRLRLKELYLDKDLTTKYSDGKKVVKKYNKVLKKAGLDKLDVEESSICTGKVFHINRFLALIDYDCYKETRIDMDKRGFKDFKKDIKEYIDAGIPLFWGCWSNVSGAMQDVSTAPEESKDKDKDKEETEEPKWKRIIKKDALIVGYNEEEGVILFYYYSDDVRRIKYEDAWTITSSLCVLKK